MPWHFKEEQISKDLNIPTVRLVNDLVATAAAVPHLMPEDLYVLHEGEQPAHNGSGGSEKRESVIGVLAPGTGLGEAFVYTTAGQRCIMASEGGHTDFAPTNEEEVKSLFNKVGEDLSLAIFNPAFGYSGRIIDMDSEYFERSWKVSCYGGFLFGREALKRMDPRCEGTIIYTGATAALRGRPNYAAFNSAKSGLRTLAQAMAKEYGPDGIHVGHMIIDGTIAGDKVIKGNPDYASKLGEAGMVNLEGIVDSYFHL